MSKGVECLDGTVLSTLLGASGMAELRSKLIDAIVEEVREQLHDSGEYIVSPDDISNDLYSDILSAVESELRGEYVAAVRKAVDARMQGMTISFPSDILNAGGTASDDNK